MAKLKKEKKPKKIKKPIKKDGVGNPPPKPPGGGK